MLAVEAVEKPPLSRHAPQCPESPALGVQKPIAATVYRKGPFPTIGQLGVCVVLYRHGNVSATRTGSEGAMDNTSRVAQWRQRMRDEGKEALTVWLSHDAKLRLEALASVWHATTSEMVEQALAQFGALGVIAGKCTVSVPLARPHRHRTALG